MKKLNIKAIWYYVFASLCLTAVIVPTVLVLTHKEKKYPVSVHVTGDLLHYAWTGHNGNRTSVGAYVEYSNHSVDYDVTWTANVFVGTLTSWDFHEEEGKGERFGYFIANKDCYVDGEVKVELTATSAHDTSLSAMEVLTIRPRKNLTIDFDQSKTSFGEDDSPYDFIASTTSTPAILDHKVIYSLTDVPSGDAELIYISNIATSDDESIGALSYNYSQLTTGNHTFKVHIVPSFGDNVTTLSKDLQCTITKS